MIKIQYTLITLALLMVSLAKGQNKWGFETMVNTMLFQKVDTISSEKLAWTINRAPVLLLDAREPAEYDVSHLEGARLIGYDRPDYEILNDVSKDTPIVVYCSVGKRSEDIGSELEKKGFTNVKNLYGGIFDWTNRGHLVVNSQGKEVKQVHPFNAVWGVWVNNYEKRYESE